MLHRKLTEEEKKVVHVLFDPHKVSGVLFNNELPQIESLQYWDDDRDNKFKPRPYQLPFFSQEYSCLRKPKESKKQYFNRLKTLGDRYMFSGRGIGKTMVGLVIDMLLDTMYHYRDWLSLFISSDDSKVKAVYDAYNSTMSHHPFFKMFRGSERRAELTISSGLNGTHKVVGISMALTSADSGAKIESHHANKFYMDESQKATQIIVGKLTHACASDGAIEVFAGITEFSKHHPIGKIVTDWNQRNKVVQLPQYVSEDWTEERKEASIRKHNGKEDPGYKVHVEARIIENTEGLYDIEKIRQAYEINRNKNRHIKHIEISPQNYFRLDDLIILDKPKNCVRTWVAEDWGEKIAEIIILFEFEKSSGESVFKYVYNITLYNLSAPEEHEKVHECIIKQIQPNFIAFDASEAGGKEVVRRLQKKYNRDSIIPVQLQANVDTDPARDAEGHVIYNKDGTVKFETERAMIYSVYRIKKLFYNNKIEALYDLKLDRQFDAMRAVKTGNSMRIFSASHNDDHEHAAWQAFAIAQFLADSDYSSITGSDDTESDGIFLM